MNDPKDGERDQTPMGNPQSEIRKRRKREENSINRFVGRAVRPIKNLEGVGGVGIATSCIRSGGIDAVPERKEITASPTSFSTSSSNHESLTSIECVEEDSNFAFMDTFIALRLMCSQFPVIDKVTLHPFVLRSQLYSSVKDRTRVDRDLELLKIGKIVRIFKLNSGQDDHAVMLVEDYMSQIEHTIKTLSIKNTEAVVFEWFKNYVVHSKMDVSIEHHELCSLLSLGGKVIDRHLSLLISSGLLIRQLIDSNMYWFAIPNIGSVLKGLSQGRKELLSFLQRRKFKEMPLASLEKKKLRLSPLDTRFHLRDLIGSGHLKTLHTPAGIVVCISGN